MPNRGSVPTVAPARTGVPARTGSELPVHALQVVAAWAAGVADAEGPGTDGLVFSDPLRLVSALLDAGDRPQVSGTSALTTGSMQRSDGSTVSSAVLQLLVLDDVLRLLPADPVPADPVALGSGRDGTRDSPDQRRALVTALIVELLAELEAVSLVDPLTGLLNRRALDRDLPCALAAERRHRHGLVVVMIDVDGLKSVNDGLGHAAGDGVLRSVAESLRVGCRPEDRAYRVGGDEFVLVLWGIWAGDVAGVMDRIQLQGPPAFTWGSSQAVAAEDDLTDEELSARLLERADHRMLHHRREARAAGRDGDDTRSPQDLSDDLRRATSNSIVIEQASGLIAERLGVDLDSSMETLRSMARQRSEPVGTTAAHLVDGTVEVAAAAGSTPTQVGDPDPVDSVAGSTQDGG